jgi:lipopolysaccharide/colanic/teichoic acid biosynthesis glycosyltransferase
MTFMSSVTSDSCATAPFHAEADSIVVSLHGNTEKTDAAASDGESPLHRVFDVVFAAALILVLLPVFALLVIIMKFSDRGPVFYAQRRVGRGGAYFPCLKFRSMVTNSDHVLQQLLATSPEARGEWERDRKLRNDPRVTPIGRIMRKTSLDELPQLFNILAGQMSVVGPRPIVQGEIALYGTYFQDYCSVRPGLTGLWQISGRNDVSYEERVQLDASYVKSRSVFGDISIVAKTVPAVLLSRGCY